MFLVSPSRLLNHVLLVAHGIKDLELALDRRIRCAASVRGLGGNNRAYGPAHPKPSDKSR